MMKTRRGRLDLDRAEEIAIHGLAFLAGGPERLGRFLALTGIGPADLQLALGDPSMLAAVLEYIIGDEPLLLELAANRNLAPDDIVLAWDVLTLEAAGRSRA